MTHACPTRRASVRSLPQASKDLSLYQERAPVNVFYDKSAKRYVPSATFEPRFMSPNPYTYLSQLRSGADGVLERDAAWIGNFPTFDAAAAPFRTVSGEILRSVLTAIRQKNGRATCRARVCQYG